MVDGNIKMNHGEYRKLIKGVLGTKVFKVDKLDRYVCMYIKSCESVSKSYSCCKLMSHKRCYNYLVNKVEYFDKMFKGIDSILKFAIHGHLNNDEGKCIINVNKGHTLQSNKKDAGG